LAAVALLVVVVVAVVIPALGNQMQQQFEGAVATARPTSRPAATAVPYFSETPTAPPAEPTVPPEEPVPTQVPPSPSNYWGTEMSGIELTHGAFETIASGTGDFVVGFWMILLDEGAGDGQINFNIQGPSESHIVGIELSTGKYAVQGGAGTASWTTSDIIETGTGAENYVEIWGEGDVVVVVVNGEALAEFNHPTTGADNIVYLTVYHDVGVAINGIFAEGIN
jgi:hypothetical protein